VTGSSPELLLDARAELGEGPAWHASAGHLLWVDIYAGRLHTFDPSSGSDQFISLGEPLGCACPSRRSGEFVLALRSGFWSLSLPAISLSHIADLEAGLPGNRFNDGKCDPAGRFLAGSMDNAEVQASGSLYSLSTSGACQTLLSGLRISNGLTWSPDGKTFYFIDTPTRQVLAFDYSLESGALSNPRPVVEVPEALGWPDGMTSDMDGMLWIAMWGGAKLTRWDPRTGKLLANIPVPALNVTACIFGGPDLSDLYITSARKGMTPEQLAAHPLTGGLFCLHTSVRGLPTYEFGGQPG
jgi:sugar lactone lactonase YvrE